MDEHLRDLEKSNAAEIARNSIIGAAIITCITLLGIKARDIAQFFARLFSAQP